MPNEIKNIVSGKPLTTGGVWIGPLGSVTPVDAVVALPATYKSAGFIGEEGVNESGERSIEKIKAWGGDTVKIVQTEHSLSFAFTFLETLSAEVLKTIYGDANVTTTPATAAKGTLHTVKVTGEALPRRSFVFEIKDGDARVRIHVADGQITPEGDITYADAELVAYKVTVECFGDAAGVKATKLLDDGKKSA